MRLRKIKGLTLIEVAMALAIATLSFLFLARLMADSSSSAQAAADAKKMTMMAKAAQTYMNVEAADLKAFITSPTQVIAIPVARNSEGQLPPDGPHATLPSVQKAGLLAAEFIDSNALGQRHVLLVKEPIADKLEGLVVAYGGAEMQDTQLGKLIQSVGMAGGGVFAKDVAPITATPIANANITGHAGGWTLPVASWSGANLSGTPISVAAGRPVVSLSMMDVANTAATVAPQTTQSSGVTKLGEVTISGAISYGSIGTQYAATFNNLDLAPYNFITITAENVAFYTGMYVYSYVGGNSVTNYPISDLIARGDSPGKHSKLISLSRISPRQEHIDSVTDEAYCMSYTHPSSPGFIINPSHSLPDPDLKHTGPLGHFGGNFAYELEYKNTAPVNVDLTGSGSIRKSTKTISVALGCNTPISRGTFKLYGW